MKMFKKISKFISYLIVLGISVSYNLFTIWGLVQWYDTTRWIPQRTTLILLVFPTLLVINIIFLIIISISFFNLVKKDEKKKEFKIPDKVTSWFKGEAKEEKDDKVSTNIIDMIKKEIAKEIKKEK